MPYEKNSETDKLNPQKNTADTNSTPHVIDYAYSTLGFIWNRVPNFQEAFTSASVTSAIELALGNAMDLFGENPTAKSVIRDFTKVPSNLVLAYNGNTVGGTGFKYDEGHLYGSIIKAVCKVTVLSAFSTASFYNPALLVHFETAARASNYICEVPARFLVLMGQKKQTANATTVSYIEFLRNNWQYQDILDATVEAIFKTFTTDYLGQLIKGLRLEHIQKTLANGVINAYVKDLTGNPEYLTSHKSSIWEELGSGISAIYEAGIEEHGSSEDIDTFVYYSFDPIAYIKAIIVIPFVKYTSHDVKSIIDAYLLAPPARFVQDTTGLLLDYLIEVKKEFFNHQEDLSPSKEQLVQNEVPTNDMKENGQLCPTDHHQPETGLIGDSEICAT